MGTYGYISIIAMVCYGFMLLMFLAAKRNKIVNSFLVVLAGLLLWTGGSAFMRAQLSCYYNHNFTARFVRREMFNQFCKRSTHRFFVHL